MDSKTMKVALIGFVVLFSTLILILVCFLCCRKRNRQVNEITKAEKIHVPRSNYADPEDTIPPKRSSEYSTPYDQLKSNGGIMSVRQISAQTPNQYFNVDVQDGLCERVDPDKKKGKRGHREYFNVHFKVQKPNRKKGKKSTEKEYWDAHVKETTTTQNSATGNSIETPRNDDVVPVREESKRPNLPTPYSCIELT